MSAKNNFHGIGNIGRDCEVRHTKGGMAIATFPLPIESGYGEKKTTTWMRCSLFGKRAEGGLVQYLVKGQQVAVQGEIKLNQYTNKDGLEKSSLDLMVNDVALLGKPSGQRQQPEQAQQKQNNDPFANSPDVDAVPPSDDIPF